MYYMVTSKINIALNTFQTADNLSVLLDLFSKIKNLLFHSDLTAPKLLVSKLQYKEKNIARNRIKSRHLDFVLVDPDTFYVKLAIELDDISHDNKEVQQKDEFKNKLLEKIGLPLIRTRDASDIENKIKEALQIK